MTDQPDGSDAGGKIVGRGKLKILNKRQRMQDRREEQAARKKAKVRKGMASLIKESKKEILSLSSIESCNFCIFFSKFHQF